MARSTNLARLYESQQHSDAIVVFTTKPADVREAVKVHMEQVSVMRSQEEQQEDQPAAKKHKTAQAKATKQKHAKGPGEGLQAHVQQPAWPKGTVVLQGHIFQLCAASDLFFRQLDGDTEALAGDKNLRVYPAAGGEHHVLIVSVHPDQPGCLKLAGAQLESLMIRCLFSSPVCHAV